jgi:hypothetical protein
MTLTVYRTFGGIKQKDQAQRLEPGQERKAFKVLWQVLQTPGESHLQGEHGGFSCPTVYLKWISTGSPEQLEMCPLNLQVERVACS